MSELKDHPQITELMETLDKNDMHREKKEVEALVDYIGDMAVLNAAILTIQHHHAGSAAHFRRFLGDQFLRQLVIEIGGFHLNKQKHSLGT